LASRLLEVDHLDLLEEIGRRERIDQEETIVEEASDIEDEWSTDESDDEVGEEEE
jgi:HEPN domain-containing protein